MKRGQKVAVCQDGKWGRAVVGTVTKTHNGNRILVKFPVTLFLDNEECKVVEVEHWLKMNSRCTKYGGARKVFSGWCDIPNAWCPWYLVVPLKKMRAQGYII